MHPKILSCEKVKSIYLTKTTINLCIKWAIWNVIFKIPKPAMSFVALSFAQENGSISFAMGFNIPETYGSCSHAC